MRSFAGLVALLPAVLAVPTNEHHPGPQGAGHSAWNADQFKSLVVFGDSYSDENRLNYFGSHNGSAPPTGTLLPESLSASDGGRIWGRYVVQYTNQTTQLYDYAVSGAVCSNKITPRLFSTINAPFPDLDGYEIPAFLADKTFDTNVATGGPLFETPLTEDNTVYAFFDGTNDIGVEAFLQDAQQPGYVLSDYVSCLYDQMDRIYQSGGRYFVLFNLAPLQLAALYANATEGGDPGPAGDGYWSPKPDNLTWISEKMTEFTTSLNTIFDYRTPVEVLFNNRYPGSHFALFDVNQIWLDIFNNPTAYLNGTAPLEVTGYSYHCDLNRQNCVANPSPDSFLWYDALHPSEQTQRIIADNFVQLLGGANQYATYYDSPKN